MAAGEVTTDSGLVRADSLPPRAPALFGTTGAVAGPLAPPAIRPPLLFPLEDVGTVVARVMGTAVVGTASASAAGTAAAVPVPVAVAVAADDVDVDDDDDGTACTAFTGEVNMDAP
jgi:hypothetical protein